MPTKVGDHYKMQIFLTGGSGVLGRRLIRLFVQFGHTVKALTRSDQADETIRDCGGIPFRGNHFDTDSLIRCAQGSEIVIHGATAIPANLRYARKNWEMNDRLRREGTRALTECAGKIGVRLYLQQSIVWVARPQDDSFFDEQSEPDPPPLYASSLDAETIAQKAGKKYGFRVIVLRCGMFYSADAIHTKMIADALRKRKAGIPGSGKAIWAMLHSDDAAAAFALASESKENGLWHVVDDQPVMVNDLFLEFARSIGTSAPRHIPVWLANVLLGKVTTAQFTRSTRTSNARFRKDFGWAPNFPGYREGLQQITAQWKTEKADAIRKHRS
jgi:2-alkyl-3-oxoalkanoate reductase